MPHKIYVGNYPSSFIEDDVLNLFQDFEGVEMVSFFKGNNKCYSFLHCISERQLIEIVAGLHDIDVCGRNLIVRAADQNLQNRIQKSMEKYGGAVNIHPRNTCDMNDSTSAHRNYGISGQAESRPPRQSSAQQTGNYRLKNTYPKKYEMGANAGHSTMPNSYENSERIRKQKGGTSRNYESHDYSSHFDESNYSSQQNVQNSFGGGRERSSYCQNFSESERENSDLDISPQVTISQEEYIQFLNSKAEASGHYKRMNDRFDSYKKNSPRNRMDASSASYQVTDASEYQARNRNASESSLETVHYQPPSIEHENLSFVSVINFPLYSRTRDLYSLFADFNPIKIFIVCNEPRMDKTPTEAIICFEHDKEATDAILTLDNTVYRGRLLIVTDAVDMSLVSELLRFG